MGAVRVLTADSSHSCQALRETELRANRRLIWQTDNRTWPTTVRPISVCHLCSKATFHGSRGNLHHHADARASWHYKRKRCRTGPDGGFKSLSLAVAEARKNNLPRSSTELRRAMDRKFPGGATSGFRSPEPLSIGYGCISMCTHIFSQSMRDRSDAAPPNLPPSARWECATRGGRGRARGRHAD